MRTDFLHKSAGGADMAEVTVSVEGAMPVRIAATDAAYLENTYSSSFVSEMAIQLTREIENRMMVSGLAGSDIALELVFAPGTYMEHPQGAYTYRRLLISESGRAIKDLWVRWERIGEGRGFTVCDEVAPDEIRFTLGEDVPQKVREKEYRFLVRADAEKYRAAMGRKNVTEWREIIKRAVKRGTLTKITIDEKVAEHAGQIKDKLEELLGKMQPAAVPEVPETESVPAQDEAYEKAMAYMRSFVEENKTGASEEEPEIEEETEIEEEPEVEEEPEIEEEPEVEEEPEIEEEPKQVEYPQESFVFAKPEAPAVDIEALRMEMERKLRAEMLEKEQELLRREYELERKRREFDAEVKEQELSRAEREIELRRQAQNQARLEWEAKERDRLTAQALEAIELRKAEEARAAEEARRAEEARIAEEARRAEEARIAEEARKAEEARIAEEARKAEEARIAEEARKAEEARIAEEARKAEEARIAEEARRAEEARIAAAANMSADGVYTYTEKKVHLIFRHPVDPNVMTRIHELMMDTIRYFKKEHVFIKVKASIPSEDTVDLYFTQFPAEEHKLLVDMIQVLGNSDLGICRVLVD